MVSSTIRPVRRALISVSEKAGVAELAQALHRRQVQILSTGGTARLIAEAGVPVVEIAEHTGFPEIMAGRVKTLHPKVHGGLLGRRDVDDQVMADHGIEPIDLLVVNLYPFELTVAQPDCSLEAAIENIDIGGPAMVRAAAKNHDGVGVVTDAADYDAVVEAIDRDGGLSTRLRFQLAVKAFEHTAAYDSAIANYLGRIGEDGSLQAFPRTFNAQWERVQEMRYGENPHQRAAFYREGHQAEPSVAAARQLQGKALSYNNIADTDAALECVKAFEAPACVIVKHANPCGVALGADLTAAYQQAFATDPVSAFGGIIAFNRPLDPATAKAVIDQQFVEVIIAPEVDEEAAVITAKKKNVRVLACGAWTGPSAGGFDYKRVRGGLLVQDADSRLFDDAGLRVVSKREPSEAELADLDFVWRVAKYVKSNAIVFGREGRTLGVGAGQMSRVDSARIGARKAADASLELAGAAMASDAFFPFRDGIDQAAEVGVKSVIQPGGSVRDDEVIAAADEHGMAMVFTGMRHFRH